MIVIRDVFHLKFGKAKEAKELMKNFVSVIKKYDKTQRRILTDYTGKSYRLIMESVYSNLSEYETSLNNTLGNDEWRKIYEKFIPLVESADREILKEVMSL